MFAVYELADLYCPFPENRVMGVSWERYDYERHNDQVPIRRCNKSEF